MSNGKPTNWDICQDMLADPQPESGDGKKARLARVQKDLGISVKESEKYFG